jgi:hypothetical protein
MTSTACDTGQRPQSSGTKRSHRGSSDDEGDSKRSHEDGSAGDLAKTQRDGSQAQRAIIVAMRALGSVSGTSTN